MAEVYKNVLPEQAVADLCAYFRKHDELIDSRPDVISKSPDWNHADWPQEHVKKLLDQVLDQPYEVEECLFHLSNFRYVLHADTNWGTAHQRLYKTILIPLSIEGPVGTCFFKNTWTGQNAKFTKASYLPYSYTLIDKTGCEYFIEDLREFLLSLDHPDSVPNFHVSADFKNSIKNLISKRNQTPESSKLAGRHIWINDYSQVGNITELPFPEDLRLQYCEHIPSEDLHGFVFDKFVPWQVGDAIVFDRTQIHSSGNGALNKLGLTVFTNHL